MEVKLHVVEEAEVNSAQEGEEGLFIGDSEDEDDNSPTLDGSGMVTFHTRDQVPLSGFTPPLKVPRLEVDTVLGNPIDESLSMHHKRGERQVNFNPVVRPVNPISLSVLDSYLAREEDKDEDALLKAVAACEPVGEFRDMVLKGAFFISVLISASGKDYLLVGMAASYFLAFCPRTFFKNATPAEVGGGYMWCFDERNTSSIYNRICRMTKLSFNDFILEVGTVSTLRSSRESPEVVAILNRWATRGVKASEKGKWEGGNFSLFKFTDQLMYVNELISLSVVRDIQSQAPQQAYLAEPIVEKFMWNFSNTRPLFDESIKKMCNEIFHRIYQIDSVENAANPSWSDTAGYFALQIKNLPTVMAATKFSGKNIDEISDDAIAPVFTANERAGTGIPKESEDLLRMITEECKLERPLTRGNFVESTWSYLIASKKSDHHSLFDIFRMSIDERHAFEKKWADGLPEEMRPKAGITVSSSADANASRAVGGEAAVLCALVNLGRRMGLIKRKTFFIADDDLVDRISNMKTYGDKTRYLQKARREIEKFLIYLASEKFDKESSVDQREKRTVFLKMIIMSSDGKSRLTMMGDRVWALAGLTNTILAWISKYSTYRKKGKVDLAKQWNKEFSSLDLDMYDLIIQFESDLTNSTFEGWRFILTNMVNFVQRNFNLLDDDPIIASWRRFLRDSVMIAANKAKPAPPFEARMTVNHWELPSVKHLDPITWWSYVDHASTLVGEFMEFEGASKDHLETHRACSEMLLRSEDEVAALSAAAGSGKSTTVFMILLLAIGLSRTEEKRCVRMVLYSRDSLNTLGKSLGLRFHLVEYGEDRKVGDSIQLVEDGRLDRLFEYVTTQGVEYDLPDIGIQHGLTSYKTKNKNYQICLSTPLTNLSIAKDEIDSFTVIDEAGENLLSILKASGSEKRYVIMSATLPDECPSTSIVYSSARSKPLAEVKGTYAEALVTMSSLRIPEGVTIAVVGQSVKSLKDCATMLESLVIPVSHTQDTRHKLEIECTWGDKPNNSSILDRAIAPGFTARAVCTTFQIKYSNSSWMLIVYAACEQCVITSACGQRQMQYMEMGPKAHQQLSARAGRQGVRSIESAEGPVSAIAYRVPGVIPLAMYLKESAYEVGIYTYRFGTYPHLTPYIMTDDEGKMATYAYRQRVETRMKLSGVPLLIVELMKMLPSISVNEGSLLDEGDVKEWLEVDIYNNTPSLDYYKMCVNIYYKTKQSETWGGFRKAFEEMVPNVQFTEEEPYGLEDMTWGERSETMNFKNPLVVSGKQHREDKSGDTVYIGRPVYAKDQDEGDDSLTEFVPTQEEIEGKWGNPFVMEDSSDSDERIEVIKKFKKFFKRSDDPRAVWMRENIGMLKGKKLRCYCAPKYCHGNILAWQANQMYPDEPKYHDLVFNHISLEDLDEIRYHYPDRVAIRSEAVTKNIVGVIDDVSDVPEVDGSYIVLDGFRKSKWIPIRDVNIEEIENEFPVRNNYKIIKKVVESRGGPKLKWKIRNLPLGTKAATDSFVDSVKKILVTMDGCWDEANKGNFDFIAKFVAGWVLTLKSSPLGLESMMLLHQFAIQAIIKHASLLARIIRYAKEELKPVMRQGVNVAFVLFLHRAIQGILGGILNDDKCSIQILRALKVDAKEGPERPFGKAYQHSTGDDKNQMLFFALTREAFDMLWEKVEPRITAAKCSSNFVQKFLTMHAYDEVTDGKRTTTLVCREIIRTTPKNFRVLASMRTTNPCSTTPGYTSCHPLVSLYNNRSDGMKKESRQIRAYLDYYSDKVDVSSIYLWLEFSVSSENATKLLRAPMDLESLSKFGYQKKDSESLAREEKLEKISEAFMKGGSKVLVNAPVYAIWLAHLSELTCSRILKPIVKIDRKPPRTLDTFRAIAEGEKRRLSTSKLSRECYVPSEFFSSFLLTESKNSKDVDLGRRMVDLKPAHLLMVRSGLASKVVQSMRTIVPGGILEKVSSSLLSYTKWV